MSSVLEIVFCLFCPVCFLFYFIMKSRRFDRLANVDMMLNEQEEQEDVSHIRMNKELFDVDFDAIKISSVLGEGGSSSVVYKASWADRDIVFKCFKSRIIMSSQEKFDRFEKVLETNMNYVHDNLLRYLGASMKPPRVGVLMEFCAVGEIINHYKQTENVSLEKKIRDCYKVVTGLLFLHSKKTYLGGLKVDDVLVTESGELRVDFLSCLLESATREEVVKETNPFRAPELIRKEENLSLEKCDVYSLGLIMYCMLTGQTSPFKEEEGGGVNPDLRPDIDHLGGLLEGKQSWIIECIEKCLEVDETRISLDEVLNFFKEKSGLDFEPKEEVPEEAKFNQEEEEVPEEDKIGIQDEEEEKQEEKGEEKEGEDSELPPGEAPFEEGQNQEE